MGRIRDNQKSSLDTEDDTLKRRGQMKGKADNRDNV